jgi:hypothetical protein
MMFVSTRRIVAAVVAAACVAVPATASADELPSTFKSDAAQSGGNTGLPDPAKPYPPGGFWALDPDSAGGATNVAYPPADFRGGDTPVDHPGASRAVTTAPTTIEVVRPERTIVRDVDEALPIALSATALLLMLAMMGITLARTRVVPRPGRGH